jgi:hypothetical protein
VGVAEAAVQVLMLLPASTLALVVVVLPVHLQIETKHNIGLVQQTQQNRQQAVEA